MARGGATSMRVCPSPPAPLCIHFAHYCLCCTQTTARCLKIAAPRSRPLCKSHLHLQRNKNRRPTHLQARRTRRPDSRRHTHLYPRLLQTTTGPDTIRVLLLLRHECRRARLPFLLRTRKMHIGLRTVLFMARETRPSRLLCHQSISVWTHGGEKSSLGRSTQSWMRRLGTQTPLLATG